MIGYSVWTRRHRAASMAGTALAALWIATFAPASASAQAGSAAAQASPTPAQGVNQAAEALRDRIKARFDAAVTATGVALIAKDKRPAGRLVEIAEGVITVDGAAVTGRELRDKLGADADLVLQLSYLDPAARKALFESATESAPPVPNVERASPEPSNDDSNRPRVRRRVVGRSGATVRILRGLHVASDEALSGDAVVIGGSADVQGEVTGSLVVVLGSATLGPDAEVGGDLVTVGGGLRRQPGARVGGEVTDVSIGDVDIDAGPVRWPWMVFGPLGEVLRVAGLMMTVFRLLLFGLLASAIVLTAREPLQRVGAAAASEPWKAGIVGIGAQLLFIPVLITTAVILALSIIGIPLLLLTPFVVIGFLVVCLIGFAAVAQRVGMRAQGEGENALRPYVAVWIGVCVLMLLTIGARVLGLAGGPFRPIGFALALVGYLVEYAAWTIGLGAVMLAWFSRRNGWRGRPPSSTSIDPLAPSNASYEPPSSPTPTPDVIVPDEIR